MIIGATKTTYCQDCGAAKTAYVNYNDFYNGKIKCNKCGGKVSPEQYNVHKSNRWNPPIIDKTLGYFDDQLNQYIGSSSDKRRILKNMGYVEVKSGEVSQIKPPKEKTEEQRFLDHRKAIKEAAYEANLALPGVT